MATMEFFDGEVTPDDLVKRLSVGEYFFNQDYGILLDDFYLNESAQVWQTRLVDKWVQDGYVETEEEGYEELEFKLEFDEIEFDEITINPFYVSISAPYGEEAIHMTLVNGEDEMSPDVFADDVFQQSGLRELSTGILEFDDYKSARTYLNEVKAVFIAYAQSEGYENVLIYDAIANETLYDEGDVEYTSQY